MTLLGPVAAVPALEAAAPALEAAVAELVVGVSGTATQLSEPVAAVLGLLAEASVVSPTARGSP